MIKDKDVYDHSGVKFSHYISEFMSKISSRVKIIFDDDFKTWEMSGFWSVGHHIRGEVGLRKTRAARYFTPVNRRMISKVYINRKLIFDVDNYIPEESKND